MDTVAKAAGVSKQTVYSHFPSKEGLYTAVIDEKCKQYALTQPCQEKDDLPHHLLELGNQFVHLIFDEQVIAMYRIVIAESQNAPDVAALFFSAGPKPTIESVTRLIHQFYPHLVEGQAAALATDFLTLLKGEYHMRCMLGLKIPSLEWLLMVHVPAVVKKAMLLISQAQQDVITSSNA